MAPIGSARTRARARGAAMVAAVLLSATIRGGPAHAVGPRWSFEEAYDNVADGDWYRDADNETATLAWGESYVMMALVAMFRATGDPRYLDRLFWHADAVLAARDDARGVADYRGVSAACWRNTHYQPADEPYCYVVHSGMIAYPIVEAARLVAETGLEAEVAYDGVSFGDKAAAYVAAARETVAAHDDQFRTAGYYVFRPDATFLAHAGRDLPLNQSNAMGRLLLALHDLTGEAAYLDKARALAERLRAQLASDGAGGYLWNYWGGTYSAPGEDVSHAAINVDFAAMAAERGVVFGDADLEAFATTFLAHVYVSDLTMSDCVGGGSVDGSSYRPQVGRWLRLSRLRTGVYTAVRDLYEQDYPPEGVGSGALLYVWALLAEHEPVHCAPFFYYVDWHDPDPGHDGDWREATAYGANILATPPDLAAACIVPVEVDAPRRTPVQQWDGAAYHTVAVWEPTAGETSRFLPYDTSWPFVYWDGGVLYQFADDFVPGAGVRVREHPGLAPPVITSTPPTRGEVGVPMGYVATGEGAPPLWWSLAIPFPTGARIDPGTGEVAFVPSSPGTYPFVVRLEGDAGRDEQAFEYVVDEVEEDGGPGGDGDGDGDLDGDGDGDGDIDWDDERERDADGSGPTELGSGCDCSAAPRGGAAPWARAALASILVR